MNLQACEPVACTQARARPFGVHRFRPRTMALARIAHTRIDPPLLRVGRVAQSLATSPRTADLRYIADVILYVERYVLERRHVADSIVSSLRERRQMRPGTYRDPVELPFR